MTRSNGSVDARMRQGAKLWQRPDLLRIWDQIKQDQAIDGFADGRAFEYLIVRAFDIEKTPVRWPFQVTYSQKFGTMEQVDGIVYIGERAFLIESKATSEPVAIESLAKLRFRLEKRPPSTMGILFSVNEFTLPTEVFAQFASPLNILLWGGSDLDLALEHGQMTEALKQKLEYATEYGLPLFPYSVGKSS